MLRDNLFGLELDPRCVQIATFARGLQAWKAGGGWRELPVPNIACSGIPVKAPVEEWTALAGGDLQTEVTLGRLHALFANADTLGSLIDPVRATEQAGLESVDWHTIAPLVQKALTVDAGAREDPGAAVFGEAAAGIARAAEYLSGVYTLVVTNPPFLGRNRQDSHLSAYLAANYPAESIDLAFSMYRRWEDEIRAESGVRAFVLPHTWLFLGATRKFREYVLTSSRVGLLARLGAGAFSGISGEIVQVTCHVAGLASPLSMRQLDASVSSGPLAKALTLGESRLETSRQLDHLSSPDARITLSGPSNSPLLSQYAQSYAGIQTGDGPRFLRSHWEVPLPRSGWQLIQGSTTDTQLIHGGRDHIILWQDGDGDLHRFVREKLGGSTGAWIRGTELRGRRGICVNVVGLRSSLFEGNLYDCNVATIVVADARHLLAVWTYVSSEEYFEAVNSIDAKPIKTNRTLVKVPFDLDHWSRVAADRYPAGLPEPSSYHPTQWLFKGDPVGSTQPLQVAVARLLGFRWPDQLSDVLDELADPDGVVCLPAVGGEPPASERLLQLLARAYGEDWSPTVLGDLLSNVGAKPSAAGLAAWLRSGFFKDHCKLFSNRPFIWQIWDGTADGFSVLVNYHRLERRLLERLTYDYLGSWWIGRARDEVANEVPGAEKRLAAAQQLKATLQLILEGESPYDIYIRWKTLAQQPHGWEPDLDDGVRLNIRPFIAAGILRANPNINWNKDRGKDPDGSERFNDLHYTLAQKRGARGPRP